MSSLYILLAEIGSILQDIFQLYFNNALFFLIIALRLIFHTLKSMKNKGYEYGMWDVGSTELNEIGTHGRGYSRDFR